MTVVDIADEHYWSLVRAFEDRADIEVEKAPGHWIARERVIPVLEQWIKEWDDRHPITNNVGNIGALGALSVATGVNERQIWRIMKQKEPHIRSKKQSKDTTKRSLSVDGSKEFLTLDMVDRLFCGMDCVHLFHLSPEQGGFSDVYLHESIVGSVEALAA